MKSKILTMTALTLLFTATASALVNPNPSRGCRSSADCDNGKICAIAMGYGTCVNGASSETKAYVNPLLAQETDGDCVIAMGHRFCDKPPSQGDGDCTIAMGHRFCDSSLSHKGNLIPAVSTAFTSTLGNGFGVDNIFDEGIASPNVIAPQACPEFGISTGEKLQIFAEEDSFVIENENGYRPVSIQVPSEGTYVFEGSGTNRIANEIISQHLGIKATMSSDGTLFKIEKLNSQEPACVLQRCPGYGACTVQ